jgi:hypothetical protein
MKSKREGLIPCIDRIPQPLSAVTNMYPITWQLCSCLLFTQRSKLTSMSVPVNHMITQLAAIRFWTVHIVMHCASKDIITEII